MKKLVPIVLILVAVVVGGVLWLNDPVDPGTGGPAERGTEEGRRPDPGLPPDVHEEGEEQAEPEEGRGILAVLVTAPDDAPAVGVRVFVGRGRDLLAKGETDGAGRVELAAPGGEGWLVVVPGTTLSYRDEVSLGPGEVRVHLAPGVEIEGKVLVDGHVPEAPMDIRFSPASAGAEFGDLAFDVQLAAYRITTRTDERGGFRFEHLPDGRKGSLVIPFGYRFADREPRFRAQETVAPARGVVLRLLRAPFVTGRVVQGGRAVPGAKIRLSVRTDEGGGSTGVAADGSGRFGVHIPEGEVRSATVRVLGPAGTPEVTVELDAAFLVKDYDLGDVALPETREITVVVTDTDGKPVQAAAVACGRASAPPTDETGRTKLEVPADGILRVGRIDTRVVEVDLAGHRADVVEVELPKGNLLALHVVEPDGKPAKGVFLRLVSDHRIFAGDGGPDPVHSDSGGSAIRGGSYPSGGGDGPARITFMPDAAGWVSLGGFRPGMPFRLQVIDYLTRALMGEEEITIGAEERVARSIEVPAARDLAGIVVDGEGKPLPRARLFVGRGSTGTGQDGRFRLGGVRTPTIVLEVRCSGYATLADPEWPVPEAGKDARIALAGGRDVLVTVADEAGHAVDSAWVTATFPGLSDPEQTEEKGQGRFLFEDLPQGDVKITALVAGKEFTIAHDTSREEARIVVPALGAALVRFKAPLEKPVIHRIRLEPVGEGGVTVTADVDYWEGRAEGDATLPAVFPGRYRAYLEYYEAAAAEAAGEDIYASYIGGDQIEVEAGKTAEVTLTR